MEKVIVLHNKTFKCVSTGECFVYRENSGKYKIKNPYWYQLTSIENGYYRYNIKNKHINHHRIIAYAFLGLDINDPNQVVDHIDGNGLNNNIENLRVVTALENARNMKNKVIKGIYKYDKFYYAQIGTGNGKRESKSFQTKEEAIAWRLEKEKEFGYMHTIDKSSL